MAEISHISRYPNGQVRIEEKRVNGKRIGNVKVYSTDNELIYASGYNECGHPSYIRHYVNKTPTYSYAPAVVEWVDNGRILKLEYWKNGIRHYVNGVSIIRWKMNGNISYIRTIDKYLTWVENNLFSINYDYFVYHNINQFLDYIELYKNGSIRWCTSYKTTNMEFYPNGRPRMTWMCNENQSKKTQYPNKNQSKKTQYPNIITYYANGQIEREIWLKNGMIYRSSFGPCVREWSRCGKLLKEYTNNERYGFGYRLSNYITNFFTYSLKN